MSDKKVNVYQLFPHAGTYEELSQDPADEDHVRQELMAQVRGAMCNGKKMEAFAVVAIGDDGTVTASYVVGPELLTLVGGLDSVKMQLHMLNMARDEGLVDEES